MAALSQARAEAPPAPEGPTPPRKMKLEDCVATALRQNPDVVSSDEDVKIAEAKRTEVRGTMGPRVHVDAYAQQWDRPFIIQFGPSSFRAREPFTWNFTASMIQPVTALFAIYQQYKVQDLGVDVATVQREATRRDTAFHVVEEYYRLLQAERLSEVAVASVDQLEGQLRQANSFHENGVVSQNDVLRAQLAVAGAKQRLIQSRAQVTLARAELAVTMGMFPDAPIEVEPLAEDPTPKNDLSIEQAQQRALAGRVEVQELDRRIEQASRGVSGAWMRLAPQVNLVGSYIHNEGSQFAQMDSAYVGATASWDVWDWGTTTGGISEARAKARQALTARARVDDEVRLEITHAYLGVGTATEALTVAKTAVVQAEENYRLVSKRYEANAATSFDVVDAEGLLTQARGQLQTSVYDYMVARAALLRAMGDPAAKAAP